MANPPARVLLIGGGPQDLTGMTAALAALEAEPISCDWIDGAVESVRDRARRAIELALCDVFVVALGEAGLELLAEVCRDGRPRPIIVIVDAPSDSTRRRAIALGAVDCLPESTVGSVEFECAVRSALARKRLDDLVVYRADYERLISIVSANFTNLAPEEIDRGIDEALAVLGRFSGVDRAFLFLIEPGGELAQVRHSWARESSAAPLPPQDRRSYGWLWSSASQGLTSTITDPQDLPPEGSWFAEFLRTRGIESIVFSPLLEGSHLIGLLGLASHQPDRSFGAEVVSLLKIVAETFVNALRRRRDQQQMIESENRFRSLLEGLNQGIVYCDRDDVVLHVSPKACDLLGYSAAEMIGERIDALAVPEESLALLRERTARRLLGISETYEIRLRRKDGSLFWAEMNATPMRDPGGRIVGTLGSFIDITAKQTAREALRLSEERLRHYFENSLIGIAISTPEKGWVEVNDYMCALHGYTREELTKFTWAQLTHPDDLARDSAQFDRLIKGEVDNYELEKRFVHRDGSVWRARLSVNGVRRPDGTLDYAIALAQDVTAERQAQEELESQKSFFRQLIDSNPNLIFAVDDTGRFAVANRAFAELLDRSVEQILGKTNVELIADAARAKRYDAENSRVFTTGEPLIIPQEMVVDLRTGRERWFQAVRMPFVSPDGKTPYVLTIAAEITERKIAEEATAALQGQLLQSHKMEAIGQLAAGVAHDLNNALAAVVGHLQLIGSTAELNPQGRYSLDTALTGCERAASLIQQLLGFSRQGKYNLEILSLRDLAATTLEFLSKVIDKRIVIELGPDNDGLFINGDSAQLQQVLTNLIINAKQAMGGVGSLSFQFGRREVLNPESFNPRAPTGFFATISITDTGEGIDQANLDKIFEPFFTTKGERDGTGLGLSMVYGIMQNHSGWVEVESVRGVGTTFTLFFPMAAPPANAAFEAAAPIVEAPTSGGGHILVIDDEAILVDLAKQFLTLAGFQVTGFAHPLEAIEWYAHHFTEIDIIILDMKMPRVDGTACFKDIRAINPSADVVIMSGYSQDTAAQEVLAAGALHFFEKPLRYPELVDWVRQYLDGKRST